MAVRGTQKETGTSCRYSDAFMLCRIFCISDRIVNLRVKYSKGIISMMG